MIELLGEYQDLVFLEKKNIFFSVLRIIGKEELERKIKIKLAF